MATLLQDLRLTLRLLVKSPLFTVVVLATLALGIGANTALFSVVNGVLLQALPFEDSDELMFLSRIGATVPEGDLSIPDGVDLRREASSFEEIALFLPSWAFDLTGDGDPERLEGVVAEPHLFAVLGIEPVLGRVFTEADNQPGGERVALISEGFWERRFGRDPDILGQTITLSDHPVTLLGVLPSEADFLEAGVDLWVPVAVETPWALEERGSNNFEGIARLAPEISRTQAAAELRGLTERLAEEYPRTNRSKILEPIPLLDLLVGQVRPALRVLLAAVGLVLLLACINLAGLLLVRSLGRRREIAVRLAVGAGHRRIFRQLLTEGMVLAILGGAAGVLLAVWLQELLLAHVPVDLPRSAEIALDGRVLVFALALTGVTGIAMSLLPAWRILHADHGPLLRGGDPAGAGRDRQRLLGALVVAEVALACLLLVGSGLLVRTFLNLQSTDLGFETAGVLTANVVLPESRYGTKEPQSAFFRRAVEELQTLPGVMAAASVIGVPLDSGFQIGHSVLLESAPDAPPDQQPGARSRPVVGDFFRTFRIPLVEGRPFTQDDDERGPRVAIVNRTFAEGVWPGETALGKRISWRLGDEPPEWMTVVGVVEDIAGATPARPDAPAVYTPFLQRRVEWQRFGQLAVRVQGDPATFQKALQEAVWRVDPTVPLTRITSMEERRIQATAQQRFSAQLLGLFSLVALVLAVQGLYGVLAFVVAQRRRELGIRKALGAQRGDLLGLVLGRGAALIGAGLVLGLGGALFTSRLLEGLLFELAPFDPVTYLAAAALLAITAIAASWLPAHRATAVDPRVTLQEE